MEKYRPLLLIFTFLASVYGKFSFNMAVLCVSNQSIYFSYNLAYTNSFISFNKPQQVSWVLLASLKFKIADRKSLKLPTRFL